MRPFLMEQNMTQRAADKSPATKTFKCVMRDIWTSDGRKLVRGDEVELPADEVDELEAAQEKWLDAKLA